jgi:hypothetical protein
MKKKQVVGLAIFAVSAVVFCYAVAAMTQYASDRAQYVDKCVDIKCRQIVTNGSLWPADVPETNHDILCNTTNFDSCRCRGQLRNSVATTCSTLYDKGNRI